MREFEIRINTNKKFREFCEKNNIALTVCGDAIITSYEQANSLSRADADDYITFNVARKRVDANPNEGWDWQQHDYWRCVEQAIEFSNKLREKNKNSDSGFIDDDNPYCWQHLGVEYIIVGHFHDTDEDEYFDNNEYFDEYD